MRAAIYARYSSENQCEKSIDDQTRVCKNYVKEGGIRQAILFCHSIVISPLCE